MQEGYTCSDDLVAEIKSNLDYDAVDYTMFRERESDAVRFIIPIRDGAVCITIEEKYTESVEGEVIESFGCGHGIGGEKDGGQ